jgi:hypothetical protein
VGWKGERTAGENGRGNPVRQECTQGTARKPVLVSASFFSRCRILRPSLLSRATTPTALSALTARLFPRAKRPPPARRIIGHEPRRLAHAEVVLDGSSQRRAARRLEPSTWWGQPTLPGLFCAPLHLCTLARDCFSDLGCRSRGGCSVVSSQRSGTNGPLRLFPRRSRRRLQDGDDQDHAGDHRHDDQGGPPGGDVLQQ